MRSFPAVLSTLVLALTLTAAPASASLLIGPNGSYAGATASGRTVQFTINQHWTEVQNFTLAGHVKFHTGHFGYSHESYGHFDIHAGGTHYWAAWDQHNYGHVQGGYSYTYNGHHHVVHWTAKAHGF